MEKTRVLLIMAILSFGGIFVNSDLASDRRALMAFREAVGGKRLRWNSSVSVCNWKGIKCSRSGVISVRLPGARLVGQIPPGSLGNLSELQNLSLRHNLLQGSIPLDLSNCKALKSVNLQGNRMSGPIPFLEWPNLTVLSLSFNDFSGNIPVSLTALKFLRMLLLENNSFTGPLPVLDLPNLVKFNVSNNNLTGPVPDNLKKFFPESFLGNNLCGESQLQQCKGIRKKHRVGRIFGIAVGGFSLTGLILAILVIWRGRSKHVRPDNNEDEKSTSNDDYSISLRETEKMKNSLVFSSVYKNPFCLEDLLRAPAQVLGKGSVGVAYRANILRLGTVVIVKRATEVVSEPTKFIQRINRIAKMTHKNLLPLKAYYCSHQEKLLVYDYMPMGSLYTILHGDRSGAGRKPLDWDSRVKIALGAAEGIEYLHKQQQEHGNIKSSNILLTNDFNACVSDFGLGHVLAGAGAGAGAGATSSTIFQNNVGYRAPEVTGIRMVSHKADVYSFGVLLLELLTGKSPLSRQAIYDEAAGTLDLPTWVQSAVPKDWTAELMFDDLHADQVITYEEEMLQLLQLGMASVALYPDQRPTMTQVVKMITDIYSKSESESGPKTKPPPKSLGGDSQ